MSGASNHNEFIPVVAAVIADQRRLLLCQRHDGPHLPLLWEFPGGKVDPGESPTRALARELREELGVRARVGPKIHEVRHTYPEKKVWIRFYATAISGIPQAHVHREVRWVEAAELLSYKAPPPNALILQRILTAGIENLPRVESPSASVDSGGAATPA